ncbi:MAG: hypothetical protein IJ807_00840 [Eubacterium sp.]|nr:hypothetical protein [Eubacterium sp.]
MLKRTYDKIYSLFEKKGGYLPTRIMLDEKISTIHIKELLEAGDIEKVSHGNYWGSFLKIPKPENYKMIEACMTNPKAVICGPSACYYHGLLQSEPEPLYIATARTDRGGMKLQFPVSRHYYSKQTFEDDMVTFKANGVTVRVYGIDRSICDSIRLESEIGVTQLKKIVEAYKKNPDAKPEKCLEYADRMRVGQIVRKYLA